MGNLLRRAGAAPFASVGKRPALLPLWAGRVTARRVAAFSVLSGEVTVWGEAHTWQTSSFSRLEDHRTDASFRELVAALALVSVQSVALL